MKERPILFSLDYPFFHCMVVAIFDGGLRCHECTRVEERPRRNGIARKIVRKGTRKSESITVRIVSPSEKSRRRIRKPTWKRCWSIIVNGSAESGGNIEKRLFLDMVMPVSAVVLLKLCFWRYIIPKVMGRQIARKPEATR